MAEVDVLDRRKKGKSGSTTRNSAWCIIYKHSKKKTHKSKTSLTPVFKKETMLPPSGGDHDASAVSVGCVVFHILEAQSL